MSIENIPDQDEPKFDGRASIALPKWAEDALYDLKHNKNKKTSKWIRDLVLSNLKAVGYDEKFKLKYSK
jgi:hypothetical protein